MPFLPTWVALKAISRLIPLFGKLILFEYVNTVVYLDPKKQLKASYIGATVAIIQLSYVKIQELF